MFILLSLYLILYSLANNCLQLMRLEIINEIYSFGKYKSICKGLAKNPLLSEELHSEFIKEICEPINELKLIKAKTGGYLVIYCVGIINNIWNNRHRVKCYQNGTTSPLFEFSNGEISDSDFLTESPDYNYVLDTQYKEALKIIDKERKNPDMSKWYEANVFYQSTLVCKNQRQLALKTGITEMAISNAYRSFAKKLKNEILKIQE